MSGFRFDVLAEYWPLFAEGIGMTLKLTIGCVICGVFLGMLLGMARMAEARHDPWKSILYYGVRWPVTIWVSFFRGTPLFVQIFLMYFAVLPHLVLTVSLNCPYRPPTSSPIRTQTGSRRSRSMPAPT